MPSTCYYYIYLDRDDELCVIQAMSYDLDDYDQSRFVTEDHELVHFDTKQEARVWLDNHYEQDCIAEEDRIRYDDDEIVKRTTCTKKGDLRW